MTSIGNVSRTLHAPGMHSGVQRMTYNGTQGVRVPPSRNGCSVVCTGQRRWAYRNMSCGAQQGAGFDDAGMRTWDETPEIVSVDFLVLGSGIAGLSYALKVAEFGTVAIVTKGKAKEGCTRYAQGGISAVLDANDCVESHIKDTLIAGAYLNDLEAVRTVCGEGPARVLELAELGASFTKGETGALHLTKEGGHSARRVVHAADATGEEIERALLFQARKHPNITFYEHQLAVDLVTGEDAQGQTVALGADALCLQSEKLSRFVAPTTLLATGGAGQVYPLTTNPLVSTGDGIAMAHRAKAAVANMEFVQFHPTALHAGSCPYPSGLEPGRAFLISEAVRGEGGILLSADGTRRFMDGLDPRKELAPRDIVARAIQSEMQCSGSDHVLLDVSHLPRETVLSHFPNIANQCKNMGVDITTSPIPVIPAQHYLCGGVKAGLNGETTIPGLFACGEVACSGLHGANRLASNSLLEGLVFGTRAVQSAVDHKEHTELTIRDSLHRVKNSDDIAAKWRRPPNGMSSAAHAWVQAKRQRLQSIMWEAAGIVRDCERMRRALGEIGELYIESRAICESYGINKELVELRNLVTVGELILSSALQRKESRGGHYRVDYPKSIPKEARATIISTSAKTRLRLKLIPSSDARQSTVVNVFSK